MDTQQYLKEKYTLLKSSKRYNIHFDKKWLNQFSTQAGVYAVWVEKEIVYIGETGSLRKRMSDLRRTYNHTFRRTLGGKLFEKDKDYYRATSSRKFSDRIEQKLNEYMSSECSVSMITVSLGRKEIEEYIQETQENILWNKRRKRI